MVVWTTSSVTQPETGTISYTWNTDGTLQKKSDARGSVEFTYDNLKRVTKKTPKMGTTVESANVVNYYYDSYSGSGTYTQNGTGRLVAVQTGEKTLPPVGQKMDYFEEW